MSLRERGLRNGGGKLARPSGRVNGTRGAAIGAFALGAIALGACARASVVPRSGVPEATGYLGGADRAPALEERVDTAPRRLWKMRIGRGTLGLPAMGERLTVLATVDRWLYAVDTPTGRTFWRYRGDAPFGPGPLVSGGKVFASMEGPSGKVVAVGLYNGKRLWTARVGDVAAPLAVGDSLVYGVTSAGTLFALSIETGRMRWSRELGASRSGPILLGGRVALVTLTDTLATVDARTGAVVARKALGTSTLSPLAMIDDSTVAVASPDGALLAVAVPSGAHRWRVATGAPVVGSPVVARDTVFGLAADCTLWAIPVSAPAAADSAGIGCITEAAPTLVRGGVLVATVTGDIVYFDRDARRRVWTRAVRGPLRQPPLVRRGQILVAPTLGEVVSFK